MFVIGSTGSGLGIDKSYHKRFSVEVFLDPMDMRKLSSLNQCVVYEMLRRNITQKTQFLFAKGAATGTKGK